MNQEQIDVLEHVKYQLKKIFIITLKVMSTPSLKMVKK